MSNEKKPLTLEELHQTREWTMLPTPQLQVFVDSFIASGQAWFAYVQAYGGRESVARKCCYSILRRRPVQDVLNKWRNLTDDELAIQALRDVLLDPKAPPTAKATAAAALVRRVNEVPDSASTVKNETAEAPAVEAQEPEPPKPAPASRYAVGQRFVIRDVPYEVIELDEKGEPSVIQNLQTCEVIHG